MIWKIAQRLKPTLSAFYRRFARPPVPNLEGDREIEYSWVAAHMAKGPGNALDFGCGLSWMALLAARKGFDVTAVDLEHVSWAYEHPQLRFTRGDVAELSLTHDSFDLIINCSSVEHVGVPGRYGVSDTQTDGDLDIMRLFRQLLKPGKEMLLTIPVGKDQVFAPRHRVYGPERLPRLLDGWNVTNKEFWGKVESNRWVVREEKHALNEAPSDHYYGLGLFVLTRPD
jgi:SAM-dependent methyltransferase